MKVSLVGSNNATSRITSREDGYSMPGNSELSTEKDLSFPKMGGHQMGSTRADASSNLGPLANAVASHGGMVNKQQQHPLKSPPFADAPQKSKNSVDHGPLGPEKTVQLPGQLHLGVSSAITHDSFPSTDLQNGIPRSNTLPNAQQLLPKISQSIKMSSDPLSLHQHHPLLSEPLESDPSFQQMQRQPLSSTQSEESLRPSLSLGSQGNGSNLMSNSTANSSGGTLDHSSTSKLLAAIAKSGLISITPSSSLESLISQPPLPSGPHPAQALSTTTSSVEHTSANALVSKGQAPPPVSQPSEPGIPPLPPGPPPSSSMGTAPLVNSATSTAPNPLSSLLSSLVAKGLISSSKESISSITEMPGPLADQSSTLPASASMPLAATLDSCAVPRASSPNELPRLESSSPKCSVLSKTSSADAEGLIGLKFKPEVIREYHLEVINSLYDLKHQDVTCEGRFKSPEEIRRYFNWHASKSNVGDSDEASRKWYPSSGDWVAEHLEKGDESVNASLEMVTSKPDNCEPVVPADEGQCICALCGEPFEDLYCEERDEWMYKGTVYMSPPAGEEGMAGSDVEDTPQGLVVHAQCKSRNANDGFEAAIAKMV